MATQEVNLPLDIVDRLENLAWAERTSKNKLIDRIVQQFVESGFKGVTPTPPSAERLIRVRLSISEELWDAAGEKAWQNFTNRSEAIRALAAHLVRDITRERSLAPANPKG